MLPLEIPTLGIEAGVPFGWERYAMDFVGMQGYGLSGKDSDVFEHFGFTAENVAARAVDLLDELE